MQAPAARSLLPRVVSRWFFLGGRAVDPLLYLLNILVYAALYGVALILTALSPTILAMLLVRLFSPRS